MSLKPEEFLKVYEKAVKRRNPNGLICPMCSNNQWHIPGGYTFSPLQYEFDNVKLGGATIPKVPIVCTNCGFVVEIAIGVLGMLPKNE